MSTARARAAVDATAAAFAFAARKLNHQAQVWNVAGQVDHANNQALTDFQRETLKTLQDNLDVAQTMHSDATAHHDKLREFYKAVRNYDQLLQQHQLPAVLAAALNVCTDLAIKFDTAPTTLVEKVLLDFAETRRQRVADNEQRLRDQEHAVQRARTESELRVATVKLHQLLHRPEATLGDDSAASLAERSAARAKCIELAAMLDGAPDVRVDKILQEIDQDSRTMPSTSVAYQRLCEERESAHHQRRQQMEMERTAYLDALDTQQKKAALAATWRALLMHTDSVVAARRLDERARAALRGAAPLVNDAVPERAELNAYLDDESRVKHLEALAAMARESKAADVTHAKIKAYAATRNPTASFSGARFIAEARLAARKAKALEAASAKAAKDTLKACGLALDADFAVATRALTRAQRSLDCAMRGLGFAQRLIIAGREAAKVVLCGVAADTLFDDDDDDYTNDELIFTNKHGKVVQRVSMPPRHYARFAAIKSVAHRAKVERKQSAVLEAKRVLSAVREAIDAHRAQVAVATFRLKEAKEDTKAAAELVDSQSKREIEFSTAKCELEAAIMRVKRAERRHAFARAKAATRAAIESLLAAMPVKVASKERDANRFQHALDKTADDSVALSCSERHAWRRRIAAHEKRHKSQVDARLQQLEIELIDVCSAADCESTQKELQDAKAHQEQCERDWQARKKAYFLMHEHAIAQAADAAERNECKKHDAVQTDQVRWLFLLRSSLRHLSDRRTSAHLELRLPPHLRLQAACSGAQTSTVAGTTDVNACTCFGGRVQEVLLPSLPPAGATVCDNL